MTPSAYNPKYHDAWAWSLSIKGATEEEIAQAFGVSVRTLKYWKKNNPSLAEAMNSSGEGADSEIEKSLYQRARGMTLTDTEETTTTDPVTGETKYHKKKTTTRQIAPDTTAIMYWLNNRKRLTGEWRMRQEVEVTGNANIVNLADLTDKQLIALAQMATKDDTGTDTDPDAE